MTQQGVVPVGGRAQVEYQASHTLPQRLFKNGAEHPLLKLFKTLPAGKPSSTSAASSIPPTTSSRCPTIRSRAAAPCTTAATPRSPRSWISG